MQKFIERYFFTPNIFDKILSFLLLPLSFLYYLIAVFRKKYGVKQDFDIKIISIGNLVSGGSGKTPFCISLLEFLHSIGYTYLAVILRGYKRETSGFLQVSKNGEILCNVADSGDEAMLIAIQTSRLKISVFVDESRIEAISYAKKQGIRIILLDDSYRFTFKKFDILLEPEILPYYDRVLPSGYYRFPTNFYANCDMHLKEGVDYKRKISICKYGFIAREFEHTKDSINHIESKSNRYILATAIANPTRLDAFLESLKPHVIAYKYYLPDHGVFDEEKLKDLLRIYNAQYILMTQKDFVKCQKFSLPIHIIDLRVNIAKDRLDKILEYLKN